MQSKHLSCMPRELHTTDVAAVAALLHATNVGEELLSAVTTRLSKAHRVLACNVAVCSNQKHDRVAGCSDIEKRLS
jgi:hypothetical protein